MPIHPPRATARFLPLTLTLALLMQLCIVPQLHAASLNSQALAPARKFHGNGCSFRGSLWSVAQSTSKQIDSFWADVQKGYNGNYPPSKGKGSVPGYTAHQVKAVKQLLAQVTSAIGGPNSGLEGRVYAVSRQFGMPTPTRGKAGVFKKPAMLLLRTLATLATAVKLETGKKPGAGDQDYALARVNLSDTWKALQRVPCVVIAAEPPVIAHLAGVHVQAISFYTDATFDGADCLPTGDPQKVFSSAETRVWAYVQYSAWNGTHTDKYDWYMPNGQAYSTGSPAQYTGAGPTTDCSWMAISGWTPAKKPGKWWFNLVVDGKTVGAASFQIVG